MLENQSNQMKTVTETFFVEEVTELIYDTEKLEEWNKYIEDLQLTGQKNLVKPEKSPLPFLYMKQALINTFKQLCPRKYKVEDFTLTPIPLEIMRLIALANKENYFSRIEVWADDIDPDPCVIGFTNKFYITDSKQNPEHLRGLRFDTKEEAIANGFDKSKEHYGYGTDEKLYLMGRWADVKQSFAELTELAKKRYIDEKGIELRKSIKENQRSLDDLELTAHDNFTVGRDSYF